MKRKQFREYQKECIERFRMIMDSHPEGYCNEQGLPSYTISNPLMRWLVWKRVKVILHEIETAKTKYNKVLDFGCGYGLFLPFLIDRAKRVIAFDKDVTELEKIGEHYNWKKITYCDDYSQLISMRKSMDLILASEVLEHVDDLEKIVSDFCSIMDEEGILLVSGPTENILYKIGRKLAGYSGEYHVRNIYHIKKILSEYFHIRKITTILPLLSFFEVIVCEKK